MVELARPYVPLFIGDDELDIAALNQELETIAAVFQGMSEGLAILYGAPSFIRLDNTPKTIKNWGLKTAAGGFVGSIDDSTGQINVGQPGLYNITINVIGDQGNLVTDEVAILRLALTDSQGPLNQDVAVFEVNSNKTQRRSWNATLVQEVLEPSAFEVQLYATADLGDFSFLRCNFQVSRYKIEGIE